MREVKTWQAYWVTVLCVLFCFAGGADGIELATEAGDFTIDGKPAFLFGISYYGALGASRDFILKDLDDMQRLGFNWIRVWAMWSAFDNDISAVDADGRIRRVFFDNLEWLIAECNRRGMIVDETERKALKELSRIMRETGSRSSCARLMDDSVACDSDKPTVTGASGRMGVLVADFRRSDNPSRRAEPPSR